MKIVDLQKNAKSHELAERIEALDIKDKMIFIFVPGDKMKRYTGKYEWEVCRKMGAISVIFCPDHMKIEAFNDEDLKSIGLQRIPPSATIES